MRVVVLVLTCVVLNSCSTVVYRHYPSKKVSSAQRDTLNRQFMRAQVNIRTPSQEYSRKAGYVRLDDEFLHLRSSVLYDTVHIHLDSVLNLRCVEDLPFSTMIAATLGGALGGYFLGKAAVSRSNSEFPYGMGVIGATLGWFISYNWSRETLYTFDDQPRIPSK